MKKVFSYDKIKRLFPLTIVALLLSFMINSCKKDESNNATNGKTTAVFNPNLTYGTMTDQDGNEYKTITIGTQTWMAENLRTTKYSDGSAIPNVTDNTAWINLTTGAYCNYNNTTSADTIATYGRLYNWYAFADSRMIAPTGWHVPTIDEWTILSAYVGGDNVVGGKISETGTTHWDWDDPNTSGTNESGFTALPSGYRYYEGMFRGLSYYCGWWSITAYGGRAMNCELASTTRFWRYSPDWQVGFSVRLVKD